jgi:hypothetical protein
LSAIFVVSRDEPALWLEPAVWKANVPPGAEATLVVDNVAVTPADNRRPPLYRSIASYAVPTYLKHDFPDVSARQELYRASTGIASWLTTNSTFAPMFLALGWWSFPFIGLVALAAAALAGHASRYRSHFLLATFVVGYCFSELWRTYLFNFGIIHFLILLLLLIPVADALLQRLRRRFR